MKKRSSTVLWNGSGKAGKGNITSQSGELNNAFYAWNTRYEDQKGTNPEELIAAAHASCFTMKLSFLLEAAGYTSEEIETISTITLEKSGITHSHLVVKAKVLNITSEQFNELAEKSKNECPVSKALNIEVTMEAALSSKLAAVEKN